MDAWCVNLGGLEVEPEAMSRFKAADTGELVGELDGDTVTFDVDPDTLYECVFVNTLVPEDSVGGETETPANTLPPTDTFGGPATPSNEGLVVMLVITGGILASVVILTPKRASRRR